MRQEDGKGTVKLVLIIFLIIVVVFFLARYVINIVKKEQVKSIQADILLVQAKVEIVKGKYNMNKDENPLKGVKMSERTDEFQLGIFLSKNVIAEDEFDKYYILNSTSLEEMDLKQLVGKYPGYFIVNYDDFEVIYTDGYENEHGLWCYKLSDLKKELSREHAVPTFNVTTIENEENAENTEEEGEESSEEQPAEEPAPEEPASEEVAEENLEAAEESGETITEENPEEKFHNYLRSKFIEIVN